MEYRIVKPDELYHHGVKGMRWGHRKQRPVSSWGRARQMARDANAYRKHDWSRSNVKNLSPYEQKVRRRTKIASGALIVASTAAMAYSIYRISNDSTLRGYARNGINAIKKMNHDYRNQKFYTRSINQYAKQHPGDLNALMNYSEGVRKIMKGH